MEHVNEKFWTDTGEKVVRLCNEYVAKGTVKQCQALVRELNAVVRLHCDGEAPKGRKRPKAPKVGGRLLSLMGKGIITLTPAEHDAMISALLAAAESELQWIDGNTVTLPANEKRQDEIFESLRKAIEWRELRKKLDLARGTQKA